MTVHTHPRQQQSPLLRHYYHGPVKPMGWRPGWREKLREWRLTHGCGNVGDR